MRRLDDEIFMTYADGAVSDVNRRHAEADMARDAEAGRVVMILRSTAALVLRGCAAPMWSDPPRRLVAAIVKPDIYRSRMHAWPAWITGWAGVGGLVAASSLVALVVAVGVLWQVGTSRREVVTSNGATAWLAVGSGPIGSEFARVLDEFAGREVTPIDRPFTLIARLTDKWGSTCQEIDFDTLAPNDPPAFLLVACRAAAGTWNVVGAVAPIIMIDGLRRAAYVRTEAAAHEALSGVHTMIGAQQRASVINPETKKQ